MSAPLEVIPKGRNRHKQATKPQQGLGQLAERLQHPECALGSVEGCRHILGVLSQGIHLHLDSDKPVVDFSVGDVFGHGVSAGNGVLPSASHAR